MKDTTKEVVKVLIEGSKKFKGEEAVEYYTDLVVTGLAILRGVKGDEFVDGFLMAATGDKDMITEKEATN